MYKNNAETEYLKMIKRNQQMEQLKQNEYEQLNYTQMQQTKIFKKPEKIDLDKYKYIPPIETIPLLETIPPIKIIQSDKEKNNKNDKNNKNEITEQNIPHLLKNTENVQFCFVISSYNNTLNIHKNLYSIINQTYKNWRVIYINDNSTDDTEELYKSIIDQNKDLIYKFTYIKNEKRYKQMYNKYNAYQFVNDLEIVCILDGDDWLSDNNVLDIVKDYYINTNNKVFTSDYYVFYNNQIQDKKQPNKNFYSENEIKHNVIRYNNKWLFKHLKTGYGILFKSIPDNYLKFKNNWLEMFTDGAEMYCVSEFSNGKVSQIEKILYVYNKDNSILYETSYYNSQNDKTRLDILDHIRTLPICTYSLPYSYIINLSFDIQKKIHMLKQITIINNIKYEFIEAINGYEDIKSNILYNEYLKIYNSKEYYNLIPSNLKFYYNPARQHITHGSLGLLQSIFKILEIFVKDENLQHITIFEDDIFVLKDFEYYLFINNKLLENKDLIYMGCHNNVKKIYDNINDRDIFINIKDVNYLIYGSYSIIISKKLANFILSFGLEKIISLNLSWDLFLNLIRDIDTDLNFYLYFKELFIPDVCKDGINDKRDMSFYSDRGIILDKYHI